MFSLNAGIVKNEEVSAGCMLMCLEAPEIARAAAPGQFLHLRCTAGHDPLLRRPISIHFVNRDRGLVYILYRILGKGTALLAGMKPGDYAGVMGPLGRGYTFPSAGARVAVVGGGIGAAPLVFLLQEIKNIYGDHTDPVAVFLGAASAEALTGMEIIEKMGFTVNLATDDGSLGFRGTVVDLFREDAGGLSYERVYACGPMPMIKGLAQAVGSGVKVEVSVEERMGCGVGACLSCACQVRDGAGGSKYAHVCTDGPVFRLEDLVL